MKTIRTKFSCISIVEDSNQVTVCLRPIYEGAEGTPENERFWGATPSGYIEMNLTNPTAFNEFKIGHSYYVDFTEVK
ncbi:MAG: hypothetical protein ACJ8BW_23885 [Ktedonobacteraceae bacterium]